MKAMRAPQAASQQHREADTHKTEYGRSNTVPITSFAQSKWIAQLQASPRMVLQRQSISALLGPVAMAQSIETPSRIGPAAEPLPRFSGSPKPVAQRFFSHLGNQLSSSEVNNALGWANHYLKGDNRKLFNQVLQDKENATDLTIWLNTNNIQHAVNAILSHTSYQEMVDQSLLKSEVLFDIERTQVDYGDIPGIAKLEQAIQGVELGTSETWSFLQGYNFQWNQTKTEHQQENVKEVEFEYKGNSGKDRRGDILLQDDNIIDTKAMQTNYNPSPLIKKQFYDQAQDYDLSGHAVQYRFSNDPPKWVKDILDPLKNVTYIVV